MDFQRQEETMTMEKDFRAIPDDGLWDVRQAGRWLSLTEHAVRTMLRRNQLPAEAIVRIGRRIRFRSAELRAWLNRQTA
jgi:excisionase family DNA binding protein